MTARIKNYNDPAYDSIIRTLINELEQNKGLVREISVKLDHANVRLSEANAKLLSADKQIVILRGSNTAHRK